MQEMSISSISGGLMDSLNTFNLKDLLRGKNEENSEDAVLGGLASSATLMIQSTSVASAAQNNLMDRNFLNTSSGESRYLAATKASFSAEQQIKKAQDSALMSILPDEVQAAAFWYGSERMRRAKLLKDTTESHEKIDKELTANIEQQVKEAMAQKDENGEPVSISTGGDAIPASAPASEAVDVGDAPVIDVASVATPDVAVADAAPAAPAAHVSVDIRV
jgi:hypothetical protein